MRFLFRLNLSLRADVGKKIGILIFGTKQGVGLLFCHGLFRVLVRVVDSGACLSARVQRPGPGTTVQSTADHP